MAGKLINARRIVEIGTLAGYSTTWLARALPQDGKVIALEREESYAKIARRSFEQEGVSEQIEIKVGDAHQTLRTLMGPFDMVFIDAEKEGYNDYLDWSLANVRAGGIIAAHNALQSGTVAAPDPQSVESTQLMQEFNQRMANEARLMSIIFPAGDGTVVGIVLP